MSVIIVLVIVAAVAMWVLSIYNNLVSLKNRTKNSFSQIDVQLKRRYDLIPNLVEATKGYLGHERGTLEAVINARNHAFNASTAAAGNPTDAASVRELGQAESVLSGALGKFMALAEAYPDLKANTTVNQLMEELSSTENKVGFSRQAFNDAVMSYNIVREQFPGSIIAGMFNFELAAQLESIANPAEREAPKVKFT